MKNLSSSTIYQWISVGTFPKQIQLGSSTVVWLESDVTKWMGNRVAARWPSAPETITTLKGQIPEPGTPDTCICSSSQTFSKPP